MLPPPPLPIHRGRTGADITWDAVSSSGKNTNGSQFFITSCPTPFLDGKHVVFGKVVTDDGGESMNVVRKIENCRTILDRPTTDVVIAQCGEM